jgi:hypothetical protein
MSAWDPRGVLLALSVAISPTASNAMIPQDFPVMDPEPAATGALGLDLGFDHTMIPAFRAGPRERFGAGLHGHWMAADRVLLEASWGGLLDIHPDGERTAGPGDLELGTTLRLPLAEGARAAAREQGRRGPSFGLGWRVKLPNAADEGELGSDETDLAMQLAAAHDLGPVRGWLGGGLAILGDPAALAAQDDLVFVQAGLSWEPGWERSAWLPRAALQLDGVLASASNPARARLAAGLAWGQRWTLGISGSAGLTPASPSAGARVVLRRRFFGPDAPGGSPEGR